MQPRPPTEEEIERARRAIMDAPTTESGIILPPHVQEEIEREHQAAEQPTLNRAQRRAMQKGARRRRR